MNGYMIIGVVLLTVLLFVVLEGCSQEPENNSDDFQQVYQKMVKEMRESDIKDPESRSDYQQIIAQVKSGALVPDFKGIIVRLPPNLASGTKSGRVYVTKKPKANGTLFLIIFPTWIGKGYNLRGYLYCSAPLTKTDTHKDYCTGKKEAIDMWAWTMWKGAKRRIEVEVVLEKKLGPNWYYVSRSLD